MGLLAVIALMVVISWYVAIPVLVVAGVIVAVMPLRETDDRQVLASHDVNHRRERAGRQSVKAALSCSSMSVSNSTTVIAVVGVSDCHLEDGA